MTGKPRAEAERLARALPLHVLAVAAALACGCNDLDRFTTASNESYCGAVTVGAPFRTGFSPRVQMRLTWDTGALDGTSSPGTMWSYEAPYGQDPARRMIDGAALRPFPTLEHDALSHLEFGDGRERNAIFGVSPADPDAESIVAVVSLKSDDSVEVRLLRPGAATVDPSTPDGRRPLYGLFSLTKQVGKCGF